MVRYREKKPWASFATNLFVALITFATGIGANLIWTVGGRQPTNWQPPKVNINLASAEIGTLDRLILEAKAKGENKVDLSVLACGWDIGRLRAALARDTVVVAELVEKRTYRDTYGLHTWYRFRNKETLVEHPHPQLGYSPFQNAPSDMLPIANDEFLIRETNGQMVIDGVTVTQFSNGARFLEGQVYLLFLWIEASKRTAIRAGTDPLGVFLVDSDGHVTSYINHPYPLKNDVNTRFNNSIHSLRQALKKQAQARRVQIPVGQ